MSSQRAEAKKRKCLCWLSQSPAWSSRALSPSDVPLRCGRGAHRESCLAYSPQGRGGCLPMISSMWIFIFFNGKALKRIKIKLCFYPYHTQQRDAPDTGRAAVSPALPASPSRATAWRHPLISEHQRGHTQHHDFLLPSCDVCGFSHSSPAPSHPMNASFIELQEGGLIKLLQPG